MTQAESSTDTVESTQPAGPVEADASPQADEAAAGGQPDAVSRQVEAALMTTDRPISPAKLAELVSSEQAKVTGKAISDAVERLNAAYEATGRTFRIEQLAGGLQIMTLPEYEAVLASLHKSRQQARLSPAAMETLAIVAYKQPILRAEIEAVRGVACGEVLRSLMERHMVKIVGRAEELGRPMLYGTTKAFLEVFGLKSLKDLPKAEEFAAKVAQSPAEPSEPNP